MNTQDIQAVRTEVTLVLVTVLMFTAFACAGSVFQTFSQLRTQREFFEEKYVHARRDMIYEISRRYSCEIELSDEKIKNLTRSMI